MLLLIIIDLGIDVCYHLEVEPFQQVSRQTGIPGWTGLRVDDCWNVCCVKQPRQLATPGNTARDIATMGFTLPQLLRLHIHPGEMVYMLPLLWMFFSMERNTCITVLCEGSQEILISSRYLEISLTIWDEWLSPRDGGWLKVVLTVILHGLLP